MIKKLKITTAIILTFLLILNIALLAMRKTSTLFFWIIIIVCAVFAYVVFPRIKS